MSRDEYGSLELHGFETRKGNSKARILIEDHGEELWLRVEASHVNVPGIVGHDEDVSVPLDNDELVKLIGVLTKVARGRGAMP